jgi:hypothetical protein
LNKLPYARASLRTFEIDVQSFRLSKKKKKSQFISSFTENSNVIEFKYDSYSQDLGIETFVYQYCNHVLQDIEIWYTRINMFRKSDLKNEILFYIEYFNCLNY